MTTKIKKKARSRRVAVSILEGLNQAARHARGEAVPGLVAYVPETVDVAAIRKAQKLSQEEFATRYGFKVAAVRDWEQNRRTPERPARILLKVIEKHPELVREVLAQP